MDYLRLRQICLVAPNLGDAERVLTDVLGLAVCYRDPNVGKYGLENALWPVGDMFLEVVAPTRAGTAAGRFLDRSGGKNGKTGGYMVIFDCSDPSRRADHARILGLRVVTQVTHEAYTGVQLHPRDCRAAMIEFNRTEGSDRDPDLYAPAGPDWRRAARDDVTREIRAIELASPDPVDLAFHWARIIERPLDADNATMTFPESALRFVAEDNGGERLSAIEFAVADVADVMKRAEAAGLPRTDRGFTAVGVEWMPTEG